MRYCTYTRAKYKTLMLTDGPSNRQTLFNNTSRFFFKRAYDKQLTYTHVVIINACIRRLTRELLSSQSVGRRSFVYQHFTFLTYASILRWFDQTWYTWPLGPSLSNVYTCRDWIPLGLQKRIEISDQIVPKLGMHDLYDKG